MWFVSIPHTLLKDMLWSLSLKFAVRLVPLLCKFLRFVRILSILFFFSSISFCYSLVINLLLSTSLLLVKLYPNSFSKNSSSFLLPLVTLILCVLQNFFQISYSWSFSWYLVYWLYVFSFIFSIFLMIFESLLFWSVF